MPARNIKTGAQKCVIHLVKKNTGGVVQALEKKFCEITGKEQAVFMPSGTMANQLAIATLSGTNSKVFVQDESHVYRDEADAAQTIFNKRLMGLSKGEPYFTAAQLQAAVESLQKDEVFPTGIGAVSIENPVRRMNGRMVPFDELQKISAYCRAQKIPLHMESVSSMHYMRQEYSMHLCLSACGSLPGRYYLRGFSWNQIPVQGSA